MSELLHAEEQAPAVTPDVNQPGRHHIDAVGYVAPTPTPEPAETAWAPAPPEQTAMALEDTGALPVTPTEAAAPTTGARQQVKCPECGWVSVVTLNRRESADFCPNCDYPLFWTPTAVFIDHSGLADESLHRLPGTVGRATVASLACPHCAEPNTVTAVDCIRCGRPMHVEAPPPPPPPPPLPVYVPPPPIVEPAPEPRKPWGWVILGILLLVLVVLGALYFTGTI